MSSQQLASGAPTAGGAAAAGTTAAGSGGGNRLQIASDLSDLLQGSVADLPIGSLMTSSGSRSRRSSLPRPLTEAAIIIPAHHHHQPAVEPTAASAASKPSFMQPTAAYVKKTKSNRSSQESRHFLFDTITPVHHITAAASSSSPKSGAGSVWDVKSTDKVSGPASSRSSAAASTLPSKAGSIAPSVAPSQRNSARNSVIGLEAAMAPVSSTSPKNASTVASTSTSASASSATHSLVSPARTVASTTAPINSPVTSPASSQALPSLNSPSSAVTISQSTATTPAVAPQILPIASPRTAAASSSSSNNATTPRLPKGFSGAARRMIEAVEQVAVQQPVAPGSNRAQKNSGKKLAVTPLAPVDPALPSNLSSPSSASSTSITAAATSNIPSPASARPAPTERATSVLTGGKPSKRGANNASGGATGPPVPAPLPFAASLLATSDLDFAPVTLRTVNLNASSAPVAVQVQPTTGRKGNSQQSISPVGGDSPISVPANADPAVIAALVEKANSRAASNTASTAVSNAVSHTNSGSNSPAKARSYEEAILAAATTAGTGGPLAPLAPHAPTAAKTPSSGTTPLSPRLASLKLGGSDAGKRKTTERAQSIAAQETFSLNTGVVKELKPSAKRSLSTSSGSNPIGIITAQEQEVLLSSSRTNASEKSIVPVLVSPSNSSSSGAQRPSFIRTPSSVAQPSPSMMSRPSVSFVATHEGMSMQEAAVAAKLREKEAQLAQSIAVAEALAAKISAPNSPVRGSINALNKSGMSPGSQPGMSPRNPSMGRLSLGGGVTSPQLPAVAVPSSSMASPRLSMRTPSLSGMPAGATNATSPVTVPPAHSRSGSLAKRASYVATVPSPTMAARSPMSINLPNANGPNNNINSTGMDGAYSPTTNMRRSYYTARSHHRHASSTGSAGGAATTRRDSMNSASGSNDPSVVSPQVDNDYAVLSDDEDPELNDLAWGDRYSDNESNGDDKEKRRDSMKRASSATSADVDGSTAATADEEREQRARRRARRSSSMISEGSGENTGTNSHDGSSPGSPSKRSSTGPFTLIDPLTGLPFDRSKKRSSAVYMGMLNDEPGSTSRMNSVDMQNVQNLLNALSPLHHAASSLTSNSGLSSPMSPTNGGGDGAGAAGMDAIMRSVKVERVELKNLRKAPTLMQQAKVITAAIIMQRQAQIAERRAIIQKKKEEAEAFEAELERRAMEQEELAKQQRIKEFKLQAERNYMREIGFMGDPNSPHHTSAPSHSRHLGSGLNLSGPGLYDSKESLLNGSTPTSPGTVDRRMSWAANRASWSRSRQNSLLNEPYSPNGMRGERRSMNFSQFDFSGTGTAWGKDQIGSHLRQRSVARASLDAGETKPVEEEEDPSKKIHPSGFGTGSVSDNNGAHHPLMNPTHPNFFSHLNPNSTNYNSHINPNHVNYNPLNNPTHPDHDPKYNNPRHPLFNPFYRLPKMMENKDFMESTQHLHKGSPTHPSHPAHPLFTPHAKNLIPLGDPNANNNLNSPQNNNIVTPSGGTYRWGADGNGEMRPNHLRINSRSSYRSDGSPLLGGMAGPPGISRPGSLLRQGSVHSPPVSPRSTFGAKTLAPLLKRQMYLQEKQDYEAAVQAEIDKETKTVNTLTTMKETLVTGPKKPLFDPKDPLASLDLTGKTGVALSKQFSKLNHRQVESIRRETVNAALGMGGVTTDLHALDPSDPHAAEKAAIAAASAPIVMSKFFRETLQKALGGDDIWKMAKDMSGDTSSSSKRNSVFDPLKGVSLSSISLKAHMALFGAGAFTDSDGRPLDEHGNYLDLMDEEGNHVTRSGGSRAVAIAPFPPKKFFLKDEVERYEAELREQLKKDHEQRVKEYEDVVNVAKRKWQADLEAHAQRLAEFHDNQDALIERGAKVQESAAFLGKAVANQWNIY